MSRILQVWGCKKHKSTMSEDINHKQTEPSLFSTTTCEPEGSNLVFMKALRENHIFKCEEMKLCKILDLNCEGED